MHLIYFDESGNSGNNLNDPDQPIFVLGALIVPESCWQAVEEDLEVELKFDVEGIQFIEPLLYRGNEQIWDVIAWLKQEQQKVGEAGK